MILVVSHPASFEAYANDEAISLSGTTIEDQTLTLDTSSIVSKASDADLIIKWQSQDTAGDWSTITGETSSTLTLGQSHVGLAIRAVVSFEDTFGLIRSLTSQTSNSVTNVNDTPSGASTTIGTMDVGQILVVDNSAIADEDGLGSISTIWQKSTDASTWTDISGASGTELTLTTSELGSIIRAKSTYVDGQGTTETIYTSATDLVYGLSGTSIFFSKNDDRSVYNIEIDQEFVRANSFAFDFDFTYDASNVNSAFANKNIIAEIGIVPTRPSGLSVNMLLTNTYSDISYDQWVASEGANLTGSADQVDTYTLEDGNYKAHFDIKTIDDYQYFVGIVSKYESDNSLTDIGITSASFNGASIENSRDFDVFVDGSYESGVSSLTNFNLAVTQLPKIFEEFEGTGDDDTIYGTSQEDVIYGYEGNDTIRGLASTDTIYGGDGNDKLCWWSRK